MPEDTLDGHTLGDGGGAPDIEGLGLLLNLLQCTGQPPPPPKEHYQKSLFILFYFIFLNLFIWLCRVLLAAHGLFCCSS